mmetsp:Transcript_10475/g.12260  ORF Transcript_10475/g.12260 Transcript_10475/m.12260 type:complete len:89 (-) Transcript_10475:433-699(-)
MIWHCMFWWLPVKPSLTPTAHTVITLTLRLLTKQTAGDSIDKGQETEVRLMRLTGELRNQHSPNTAHGSATMEHLKSGCEQSHLRILH